MALHDSMTDLLKQYDREVEKIYPGRTYFFENAMGNGYSRQWVVYIFRKLWEKANGKNNRPVAYELRHHYAVENINRWGGRCLRVQRKAPLSFKIHGA